MPQVPFLLGDNGNDQSRPGGEGQLDLEYMMALAPGSDTFYYSFSDLNPFNAANEGAAPATCHKSFVVAVWPPLFPLSRAHTHVHTIHALFPPAPPSLTHTVPLFLSHIHTIHPRPACAYASLSLSAGFLAYLFFVGNEPYPPLVHSLSYGDVEQNVFNASVPGSVEYGRRYARHPLCLMPCPSACRVMCRKNIMSE